MPARREFDHIGQFNFRVEIDGVDAGFFKGVDGLSAEIEVIEFQDGDDLFLRKRPGIARYGDVTLKKGYIATTDLMDWWEATRAGAYDRRNVSIVLNDNAGSEIRRWNLTGCWPRRWELGPLEGGGAYALFESVTIVVERIQMGG